MPEWFKNESFWKETYNFLFPDDIFDASEEHIENILKIVDIDVSSVLGLCCGPGICSIGYFYDKSDDMVVLKNVFTSLKPGGAFLIDVMGKERLAKIFQPTVSNILPDGTLIVQRPKIYDDWTHVKNDLTIIKGEQAITFTFHHTVYSGQELKERMEQSGFENIKLYGSLDGSAYDSNAQRLVIVGFKPRIR
jgi:SAM-dependent methyltransferase